MARLDPTNDYAFKKIFATEKNKNIMISFLNDILEAPERLPIQNIHYLNPQHDPAFVISKPSCVDVMCTDTSGHKYVVEMQMANHDGFTSRCQYYASKTYSQQILKGANYKTLKEVILIVICNFILFKNKKNFFSYHVTLDKETLEHNLKDISYIFLELPKFTKKETALKNHIDDWCYFLKYARASDYEVVQHANQLLSEIAMNETEQMHYDVAQKIKDDLISRENTVCEEGKEEGVKKGIFEERKKILQKFLKKEMPKDMILEMMEISEDEYDELYRVF